MKQLDEQDKHEINEIIAKMCDLPIDFIKPTHSLEIELGFDSMDKLDLIMKVEKHFNIHIPDSLIEEVILIEDIYKLVSERI